MLRVRRPYSHFPSSTLQQQKRTFLSSIFGGGDKDSSSSSSNVKSSPSETINRPDELFMWPENKNSVDPMKAALLDAGAYVDKRVHWLPYAPEELEYKQATTLGPPIRMASLTVSEQVNNGTLLCCLPLDLCPAPVFVKQTPQLVPLFDNVKTDYSATVGDATFALAPEPICSILLMTFGVVAEGPLQKLFQAITAVENIDSRVEMLDTTKKPEEETIDPDKKRRMEKTRKGQQQEDNYLDDSAVAELYIKSLATCLPKDFEQYLLDLMSARTQVLRELYTDCFGKGTMFENACQFEDFCTIASLYQSRSIQAPPAVADTLHGVNSYIPFYDCADHDPDLPDAITLKVFRNPTADIPENVREGERGFLKSADRVPNYVTPACQMSAACIGVFATQDLIPREPITRNFGREYRKMRHEGNLSWLMHHGSVPWDFPEGHPPTE